MIKSTMEIAAVLLLAASLTADQRPSVVHLTAIEYPYLAHLTGLQGVVKLVLIIDQKGAVSSVRNVSGPTMLSAPTATALRQWTFSPCASTECEFSLTIRFVLEGGPLYVQDCKTKFSFDEPDAITVETQRAKAFVN
jgi:outer membrane biosynthesis protein TonB